MKISIKINSEAKTYEIDPRELLLNFLRRIGWFGAKRGCDNGDCGACAVLVEGKAVNSCVMFAAQCKDREVVTIEGLGTVENPHPLQLSFVEHGGVQCGFCIPGLIISAKALLDENPSPAVNDIREALSGNLCRCTGYVKQISAVQTAAKRIRDAQTAVPKPRVKV